MDCREVNSLLADYSASNLKPAPAARVAAHLQQCSDCRAQLAELVAAGRMVEGLEKVEPPTEVWHKIMARQDEFLPALTRRPAWGGGQLRWAFASAVTAIVILVLSVTLSLHYFSPRPPEFVRYLPDQPVAAYQPAPVAARSGMSDYFTEHAAISTRDSLSDPVSMGLISFTSEEIAEQPE